MRIQCPTLLILTTLTQTMTIDNLTTQLHDFKWTTIDNGTDRDNIPTLLQQQQPLTGRFRHKYATIDANIANGNDAINAERSESLRDRKQERREAEQTADALEFGFKSLQELVEIKEPVLYRLGLYLDENHPASRVGRFGAPNRRAIELSRLGYASLEAHRKITETNLGRQSNEINLLDDGCPLRGLPRCPATNQRYRTADGTCNNLEKPWRGSALLPMQRFLPPVYNDGIEDVRRSVFGSNLPSARLISTQIHRDNNLELPTVNLLLMQWGQLIDHDLTSTVKSRGFNGTIPRCCGLPPELTHPICLPIEVPENDWNLSAFGVRCLEFTRSAPSTRINCNLGWREQINQVTSFLDASSIYGSDIETTDSIRTFRNGKLQYGRPRRPVLTPPDPPNGELCRAGAITLDCFQITDGRIGEQPALIALHTIWIRYHNKLATVLSQINDHWSDEKVFQETRRIVGALLQQITYREFLPIVLGQEVMELFDLKLEQKGYYQGYNSRINPTIANSFSTAAFRFGHSLVQNSFIRTDTLHRPIFNNVSLHQEQENIENIWSLGSLDRLILGLINQPSQRRDEFIADELTNHLFQNSKLPFGLDLAAINIQRGRDHGLPPYTHWRQPCGLSPIKNWSDLLKIMSRNTVVHLKSIYNHIDDIDLFTGGLAERPVRGGLVGPTFACIIAQQFTNLRKGDRFWYENGGFESSFTPAQLQQLRHITLAHILCQSLTEIETIQPFVLLIADDLNNRRIRCDDSQLTNFDITPWLERDFNEIGRNRRSRRASKRTKTTETPLKINIKDISTQTILFKNYKQYNTNNYVPVRIPQRPNYDIYANRKPTTTRYDNDLTHLYDYDVTTTTQRPTTIRQKPIEVNIKIQYYPPTTTTTTTTIKPTKRRRVTTTTTTTMRPYEVFTFYRPIRPTTRRPYIYPTSTTTRFPSYLYYSNDDEFYDRLDLPQRPTFGQYDNRKRPSNFYSIGQIERIPNDNDNDQFDFKTKFVKISSIQGGVHDYDDGYELEKRENDENLGNFEEYLRLVDLDIAPNENRWIFYNATNIDSNLELPKFKDFDIVSHELPKPMTIQTDKITKT